MKSKFLFFLLATVFCAGTASAQLGFGGIVYDPTNYQNALLRYSQLQQQLAQLKNNYDQLVNQYNLAVQMARSIQDMPARYRAQFSQWHNASAQNTYGNTGTWIDAANSGQTGVAAWGYQQSTPRLLPYSSGQISGMNADELARVESQYATVELADGANTTAIATIGAIRGNSQNVQVQINNLEQDSFSNNPNLNSEISVLNKINAAAVLTLRTLQDSNKLLASLLEEQTILAKQQREATTNTINADIARQATLGANVAQLTGTITNSLETFRMP